MQDRLKMLWTSPSRVVGWGVVVAIHALMWQVFTHGLNVMDLVPALQPAQVVLLERQAPPEVTPQPPLPKVETVINQEIYVPAPEVTVAAESSFKLAAITHVPVATMPVESTRSTAADSGSAPVPVIADSEVDYLVRPEIRYPLAAKRAREQGTVLLSVIVDERGVVRHIRVFRSSGHARLDEVALRALRAMRVKPYRRNGTPLAVEIRVPVEFSLSNTA